MPGSTSPGEVLTEISNALVRLHKEYYGKGPTKTRTFIVEDTVVCVLRGGFTAVERTLVESGQEQAVRDIRLAFQQTMRTRFTEVIEGVLGRNVIAYLSQIHIDPDVVVEVFLLEPVKGGDRESMVENQEGREAEDE